MSGADFWRACRKCVAIGKNYAKHATEMGGTVPKTPMMFLKPPSTMVQQPRAIRIPPHMLVHHEIELGVVMGRALRDRHAADVRGVLQHLSDGAAMDAVAGYVLALDLTARDEQAAARKNGTPWSVAKGRDDFLPISVFVPKSQVPDPHALRLWLRVNGRTVQDGLTRDMVFGVPRLIRDVDRVMAWETDDLLLTGTPEGVGPVAIGDIVEGGLETEDGRVITRFQFDVAQRTI
ncbi:hypothetical protein CXG81DRAFT_11962 [Caulochytrium protostelioides]|uniref:Fumarylacetoacetase-like C-terminal domain-containing protein n=1 Tax=Caulochytrium protostelioides TaxID=1555241 RepID=A0A4P9X874_9FUNG|nr:hypothetical protein CXG81DRAFT_11962 [Caulochytrium protostelioides]|eukprot:RKP01432.1 hypothetical protein CXG81DRAFT_11962 [Caulochytrium protostelioides]